MNTLKMLALCFALAGAANCAVASGIIDSNESLTSLYRFMRIELASTGGYASLPEEQKAMVAKDLAGITALLQRHGSFQKMGVADRLRVYNAQEHLAGLLNGDLPQRHRCESAPSMERPDTGAACPTYAQLDPKMYLPGTLFSAPGS